MNKVRGTLKKWISDRGFGFVRPDEGGRDVFVHVRDFGAISREPRPGDVVWYQPRTGDAGKIRGVNIDVEGLPREIRPPSRSPRARAHHASRNRIVWPVAAALVVGALIKYLDDSSAPARDIVSAAATLSTGISSAKSLFTCRGKTYCTEMRSCEEAEFYLYSCPNTKMDGDGDGIPCERQWC